MDDISIITGVIKQDGKYLLDSKIEKEIQEIKAEKDRLDSEVQKYDQIVAILDRLPNELGWPLPFLPVTNHAFLPGAMLSNTNEVQVHIGDGWFTRCSAHHAKGICHRRQEKCRKTKALLEEREKQLMSWLQVALGKGGIAGGNETEQEEEEEVGPSDAFTADEIVEFVSEEEYLQDKERHEQLAREHYLHQRELLKQKQQLSNEELWARLDELEMEEASSGELRSDPTTQVLRTQGGASTEEQQEEGVGKTKKGGVRFEQAGSSDVPKERGVTLGWSWDDGDESEESSENEASDNSSEAVPAVPAALERPRKLSFAEHIKTGSDETSVIEFGHTPVEPSPAPSRSVGSGCVPESPSDIYATYSELFAAATTPKSILKRRSREECEENWPALSYPCVQYEPDLGSEEEEETSLPKEQPQVLLDIVEKQEPQPSMHSKPNEEEKKISKFRAARLKSVKESK